MNKYKTAYQSVHDKNNMDNLKRLSKHTDADLLIMHK